MKRTKLLFIIKVLKRCRYNGIQFSVNNQSQINELILLLLNNCLRLMQKANPQDCDLKIKMLPEKLQRISSEDNLYSEYAYISEFVVVLSPETQYSINVSNDTKISLECFANKITSQFKEDYIQFRELKSLKIKRYLKKEQDSYVPIELNEFSEIPSPLYIELSSNEVWVNIKFEIQTGKNIFNAKAEALLNRALNKEDTNLCLIKAIIAMWNQTYREMDYLDLHYLITHYNVEYAANYLWFEEAHANRFLFNVTIQLKMISVEELIFLTFQSRYKNRIEDNIDLCHVLCEKFANMKSFSSFANERVFEKEYKLIKNITHNQLFKLNKANKVYVHYSSWGYKEGNLNHPFFSDNESMMKLNVIVRPKIRPAHTKNKSKSQLKLKAQSFKGIHPNDVALTSTTITVVENNNYFDTIPGPANKMYIEKSHDENNFKKKKKKTEIKESEIERLNSKLLFQKIHLHSNIQFKTFEENNSDNSTKRMKSNGLISDHSDRSNNKSKSSIARDMKWTINTVYVIDLMNSASKVKIPKFAFDKYPMPRIRNFKQQITLKSYWYYYKYKCTKSHWCYGCIAFLIILIFSILLIYFVTL